MSLGSLHKPAYSLVLFWKFVIKRVMSLVTLWAPVFFKWYHLNRAYAQTAAFLHFMAYIEWATKCGQQTLTLLIQAVTFGKLKITKRKHTKQRLADPKLYLSRANLEEGLAAERCKWQPLLLLHCCNFEGRGTSDWQSYNFNFCMLALLTEQYERDAQIYTQFLQLVDVWGIVKKVKICL